MIQSPRTLARLAALAFCLLAAPALAEPARVKVEAGRLAGEAKDGVGVWRNIPYAAPPTGALRWAPPARAASWTGERDATKAGPSCLQKMNADGTPNSGGANGPMSEDCLQLNVFAPAKARKAPVMVWIHGGSHREGAGWIYDGSAFARQGIVVVTINYRLGPLGYFAHPALTSAARRDEPLANYGLMDQVAALQWVKRNIEAFGGDPRQVTVFGESAGGMSTLALLATPSAKGLYARAIVQSGGGWFPPTTLAAKAQASEEALAALGHAKASAADLRALPADSLIKGVGGSFGPFPDGRLLKETPSQAFAAGRAADVPLIIGWNSGEDSLMGPWRPEMIGAVPAEARTVYAAEAARSDEALARAVFTDRAMGAPARWIARQAASGAPAWLYHFSYVGTRFRPFTDRAAHAAEIQYVFQYWGRRTPMSAVSEEDKAMAVLMNGCWAAFAKTGRPDCPSGQAWPIYSKAQDTLLEFGRDTGLRTGFQSGRLDFQEARTLSGLALP